MASVILAVSRPLDTNPGLRHDGSDANLSLWASAALKISP